MDEGTGLGAWMKISVLGSGSFGVVTLWRNAETHDCVAIKKCRWEQPESIQKKQRDRWTQEVDFMRSVNHPNIVGYKQLPQDFLAQLERYNLSRLPLLPMEYCGGGNLRRFLNQAKHACGLREPDVRRVLDDISAAVAYLHRSQITHRDIKPENVVLQNGADGRMIYKLIDLGYAKDMNLLMSYVGTLAYTAPEIFKNEPYNHNVDYWSFGIMAFEICCGKHPFIPKIEPMRRFALIEKKGPRDICVYQCSSDRIINTDKIAEPNHINSCLRTHLEDWLVTMLQYHGRDRGRTQTGANVFTILKSILDKQILHVFAVYNYSHHYYEINAATKLHHLQHLVQESTGLLTSDQLIIGSSTSVPSGEFYTRLNNPNATLISDLGLSSQSTVVVLKKNEFVHSARVNLPPAVKNLLNPPSQKMPWDNLSLLTSQAVHYIEEETGKMLMIVRVVNELFEFLKVMLCGQDELLPAMKNAAQKALLMVEFCKKMNADCWYDKGKVGAIQNLRKQLWRVRELIENVNAAIVRFLKSRNKTRLLMVSRNRVLQWIADMDIKSIYDDALDVTSIKSQKAMISADGITRAICKCMKKRREIQTDSTIVQHIDLCFKILREHNKLTRWMRALTEHLGMATADLLDAQKRLSRTDQQIMRAESASSMNSLQTIGIDVRGNIVHAHNGDDHRDHDQDQDRPSVEDLCKDNRKLRCKMQDVVGELLSTHKSHAISVGEFVQFIDRATIDDYEDSPSGYNYSTNQSTAV